MSEPEPYATAAGVESAIKDAAKKAGAADPSLDVHTRIQFETFNRFLSRVFSQGGNSDWILKGGTSILARVPSTRSTRDIDLYRQSFTLTQALDELTRLAAIDLQDHFRFEFAGRTALIGHDTQPYAEGCQVKFNTFIGLRAKGLLHVDLVVGAGLTGDVTATKPATTLDLPRLISHPYRLFPVVDQIADKVCATITEYKEGSSSREKDLVDLVVFATTQDVEGTALRVAISTEARRRLMAPIEHFSVPSSWGHGYAKLNKSVPYCAEHRTVERARDLVARLIDPSLAGDADNKAWSHKKLEWVHLPPAES